MSLYASVYVFTDLMWMWCHHFNSFSQSYVLLVRIISSCILLSAFSIPFLHTADRSGTYLTAGTLRLKIYHSIVFNACYAANAIPL